MFEIVFVLIIMFIAYLIYRPAKEQKPMHDAPVIKADPEQPIASVVTESATEQQVTAVKPEKSRPEPKTTIVASSEPIAVVKGMSVPELVGIAAGNVWNYLDKNGPTTVAKLVREIQNDEKTIQRSIGWLAQEDKITLKIINRAETVSLKE